MPLPCRFAPRAWRAAAGSGYNARMPDVQTTPSNPTDAAAQDAKAADTPAPEAKPTPANPPPEPPEDLGARVEAALLTLDRAITAGKLGEALGGLTAAQIDTAIEQLNKDYEQSGRSFRIERVAGGYEVLTLPQYADVMANLHKTRQDGKLSPAQLETLAIIAYKQPILRSQIEAIRGAASGEVIRALMERHLVKIVGRAEEIGRPMLYGTTKQFLEVFGLAGLKDLPQVEALNAGK